MTLYQPYKERSSRLLSGPGDMLAGVGNARVAAVRANIHPFGIDKFNVANPHQSQHRAQVRGDRIAGLPVMDAAARTNDHRTHAFH